MDWDADILHNFPLSLNSTLGSILIIILILLTYTRMYTIDRFRRNIFCLLLAFCLAAMVCDFAFMLLTEIPGALVNSLRFTFLSMHYFFQVLSCYFIMVFVDYMIFAQRYRSGRILNFTYTVLAVYALVLIFSYILEFYFKVDPAANAIYRESMFYLRAVIGYGPLLFSFWEILKHRCSFKKSEFVMFLSLVVLFITGISFCFVTHIGRLSWSFETVALLYTYFFIVQSHASMDPLTKTGNRLSFNEFTDKLSRFATGESWAIVMIDMDHFKQINDTLGHQEGDHALGYMAEIINSCIKKDDFVARYGGDEFVLAAKVEKDTAESIITKLMGEIQLVINIFNEREICPFKLEISYGYDVYTADGSKSMTEFMNHIDSLMYIHKNERRRSSDQRSEGQGTEGAV